ncbi:MAG TPA: toll/interleukin-1 receptor domain-containing protein [Vicinamibacterales bacterium]|nr:toll/interleukin-1 receptor domain-containing protein [Vicinamibacterales bacterium]
MTRLFISHAHDDADTAARIVAYLESHGTPCWISSRDIPPRSIYADAITEAMQACSACVVLLTSAANQSKALKRELELASHYEKPFIPIRVDGVEPAAGLDYYLRNTQWVEYARDGDQALDRIVAAGRDVSPPGQAASRPVLDAPPVPARAAASRTPLVLIMVGVVVVVLVVVAARGWFAGRGGDEPAAADATDETSAVDPDVLKLAGSYNWDGIECEAGPTVTLEDDVLVFTMPGTETHRHKVLKAEPDTGGYGLRVVTRVTEPSAKEGETYVLGMYEDLMSLDVISGGHTDTWQRCP